MSTVRLAEPVIFSLTAPRKIKSNPKNHRPDVKRFKKETGLHLNVVKGLCKPVNRYKNFSQEEKDHRKAQVQARRDANPRVKKQESRLELIRRAKKHNKFKRCSDCNQLKTYPEFDRRHDKRLKKMSLRSYCRECRSKRNREDYLRRTAR